MALLLSIIFLSFFFLHGLDLYRKRNMPPGPTALPLIGNLLQLGPKPHESLANLAKKHGPLMTIRLGTITTVVASSPDAAREILQHNDEACSGRVISDAVNAWRNHDAAVIWIPANEEWRTIRKALKTFLTHKNKLNTLADLRRSVVEGMVEFLRESGRKKEPVDIGKLAFTAAVNMMSNTCLSKNVTSFYESNDLGSFKTAVKTVMEVDGKLNIADIFPVLKPLDPQNIRRRARAAYDWLDKVTEGFVNERLKHRELKLPRFGDMLDSLLDYSEDNEAIKFNLKHIKALLVDLFLGGTETSSNTTEWAMTELLINPLMFSRVRKEVSTTVGEDGKIQEAKILDLPYLHAVIKETMRLHLAVPLLVPHKTEVKVKFGKHVVPKNTQVLVNAWAMARDPKYWDNPLMFKPERFLDNELDYTGHHYEFIPFGSGRRICPGMPLAHRVVSLMVATFVYHFDWKLPHAIEEMDMANIFGLTLLRATPLVATPIPMK